jgi:hypothetical protein
MVIESDSAKHSVNADTSQYSVVSKWSAKTDSSLHAINADTSAFSKTGAWSLKSDSAKHSINSDTAQYSLVAKWSSKSDSSLHAINADTSEFSKTGAWALRSDSAKYAINIADSIVTNEKLAGAIAATKLIGTDIDKVGTLTLGEWKEHQYLINLLLHLQIGMQNKIHYLEKDT